MPPFNDIDHLPVEAQKAIDWMRDAGISNGTSATTFDPDALVPRWQNALFIYRLAIQLGMVEPDRTLEGDEVPTPKYPCPRLDCWYSPDPDRPRPHSCGR